MKKILRKFEKNYEILKKIGERLRKYGESLENPWNFKINFENVWKKNFRIIKSRNHRDEYFEKILRKNLIKFYKKFEEQSQKFKKNFHKFLREFLKT